MKGILIKGDVKESISNSIKDLLRREYQFSLETKDGKAKIAFYKGNWSIQIDNEPIVMVSDSPEVVWNKTDNNGKSFSWGEFPKGSNMSLSEAFVECRIKHHSEKLFSVNPCRDVPAESIYDFLKLRLHLEESEHIECFILKAGRDGLISDFTK